MYLIPYTQLSWIAFDCHYDNLPAARSNNSEKYILQSNPTQLKS